MVLRPGFCPASCFLDFAARELVDNGFVKRILEWEKFQRKYLEGES